MQVTFRVPAQMSETRMEKPALLCWAAECTALLTASISGMLQALAPLRRLHCGHCSSQSGAVLEAEWWSSPAPSAGWETAALCLLLKVGQQPCWEGRRLRKGRVERQPGERIYWGCHCSGMLAGLVSHMPLRSSDGIHCLHRIACPPSCMCREGTTCIITH